MHIVIHTVTLVRMALPPMANCSNGDIHPTANFLWNGVDGLLSAWLLSCLYLVRLWFLSPSCHNLSLFYIKPACAMPPSWRAIRYLAHCVHPVRVLQHRERSANMAACNTSMVSCCSVGGHSHILHGGLQWPGLCTFGTVHHSPLQDLIPFTYLFQLYSLWAGQKRNENEEVEAASITLDTDHRQGKRYCEKCKAPKPPRAHHCRHCNKCVMRQDHHCTQNLYRYSYINNSF